ncbi:MAG TPA: hypothetical protein VFG42_26745 [Baekduia sp.]|uniref:hypothetical protein n=1 Tax=Baekduia sp. TaxID=2600305 RepID=UPI002D79B3D5|nr:hypothetical protein [Baekduia sp.]HET6510422.1 hypothetical protein [Baekduia sp.]
MSVTRRRPVEHDAAPRPHVRSWRRLEPALAVVAPCALLLLLLRPMLTTHSAFSTDWPVHLWLLRHQGEAILHDLHPSFFVHSDDGVFYPHFAFYGGTIYTLGGPLVALLGDQGRNGYVLEWGLLIAMAYGGWCWLGRLAGLGRWERQAPAAVFVTAPYFVGLLYTRGAWPEVAALTSIPLLLAAIVAVLRDGRVRLGSGCALAGATIVFTGSHGQTLLWTTTLAVVLVPIVLVADRRVRERVLSRVGLQLLGVIVPALLVNAWFLVPGLAYASRTFIASASAYVVWERTISHTRALLPGPFFTLRPTTSRDLGVTLPVLAMAWAAVLGIVGRRDAWARLTALLALPTTVLVVLIVHGSPLTHLPKPYLLIQYTYRLENYILLAVVGGVLVGLVIARGLGPGGRRAAWVSLGLVIAVAVVEAGAQEGTRPGGGAYSDYWSPQPTGLGNYASSLGHEFTSSQRLRVTFPARAVHRDRVTIVAHAAPGQLVDTNLVTMPALLRVRGASVAGYRASGEGEGIRLRTVLRIAPGASPGAARVTVEARTSPAVLVGRILSLLGLVGLLANVLVRWRGRGGPASPRS